MKTILPPTFSACASNQPPGLEKQFSSRNLPEMLSGICMAFFCAGLSSSHAADHQVKALENFNTDATDIPHVDSIRLSGDSKDLLPAVTVDKQAAVEEVAGNMLQNSDFEKGTQGWGFWGTWDGGIYTFATGSGENTHTGASSAAIICERPGRGGMWAEIHITVPGTYKIRLAVKGTKGADAMRYTIERKINNKYAANFTENVKVSDKWITLEKEWTAATAGTFKLYLYHMSSGNIYIDSMSMVLLEKKNEKQD